MAGQRTYAAGTFAVADVDWFLTAEGPFRTAVTARDFGAIERARCCAGLISANAFKARVV